MMHAPNTIFYESQEDMAETLANYVAVTITEELEKNPNAVLVLPGGSSPRELIIALAQRKLPWDKIEITTTDERLVPLEDTKSNAGQIKRLFLSQGIDINLKTLFDKPCSTSTITILGMGLDAHIASLFPQANNNYDRDDEFVETQSPQSPHKRISRSLKNLLQTKNLILLVPSKEKWELCQQVINQEHMHTPLAILMKKAGNRLSLHITDQ